MIVTSRAVGAALTLIGIVAYAATDGASVTALLPTLLGVPLLVLGLVAGDPARAGWAVPATAGVALLGFLATLGNLAELPALVAGEDVARPAAVITSAITAVLCLPVLVAWWRDRRTTTGSEG